MAKTTFSILLWPLAWTTWTFNSTIFSIPRTLVLMVALLASTGAIQLREVTRKICFRFGREDYVYTWLVY